MLLDKMLLAYYEMQRHSASKKLIIFLQKYNFIHKIKYVAGWGYLKDKREEKKPTKGMRETQTFFEANRQRIEEVMKLMADDISKEIYMAAWAYRMYRTSIQKKFFCEKNQYLLDDILTLENNEVFVDGGGYVGDTIEKLYSYAKKNEIRIRKIVTFEPEKFNYSYIQKLKKKHPEIVLIKKGLSSEKGTLFFNEKGVCARIVENINDATTSIPVINIDAVDMCQDATYIKMDIEGAELDALKGAETTIKKNHPKLAICIYHKNEDMISIIEYIHQIVPEYKIYVRHHSKCANETVCYAER